MRSKGLPTPRQLQLLALVVTERIGRDVTKLLEKEVGRRVAYTSVYTALGDLEERGWVKSRESERGGRRIRLFKITGPGERALNQARDFYSRLSKFTGNGEPSIGGIQP